MKVRVQVREARSADTGSPLFGARAPAEVVWADHVLDSRLGPTEFGFSATDTTLPLPVADPDRLHVLGVALPNAADQVSVNWYDAPALKADGTKFAFAGGEPVESYVIEGDPPRPAVNLYEGPATMLVRGLWLTTMRLQSDFFFTIAPAATIAGTAIFVEGEIEADIGVWPAPVTT